MPDRLCPFCGKPNPEDAEVCLHCQARLISPSNPLPSASDSAKQELSAWLESTREDAAKSAGIPLPPKEKPSDEPQKEDTPDWLARIRERSRAEQESAKVAEGLFEEQEPSTPEPKGKNPLKEPSQTGEQKEKPDEAWLNQLRSEKTTLPAEEPEESGEELPTVKSEESERWLKKLDGWEDTQEAHPGMEKNSRGIWVKPFHTSDLKALEEPPELEPETHIPPKNLPKKEEPPDQDWLEKARQEAVKPEVLSPVPPREPIPDWLEELESTFPSPEPPKDKGKIGEKTKTGGTTPLEKSSSGESISATAEDTPEWLKNVAPTTSNKSKLSTPAFIQGEEPNSTSPFSQPNSDGQTNQTPEEGGLTPAQLPSWLQALRPVESVLPENLPLGESGGETGSGALAGLANVIPNQGESNPVGKPLVSTPTLRVDERQKVQAQLLESVLHAGDKAVEIPKEETKKRNTAGRILTSLLLTILLAIPIVMGSNSRWMPPPGFFAPETVAMATGIQALAPDSRVLVILDYQPSLSGELQTASLPVIEHLMAQNASMAVISTTPSGPILANNLVQVAQRAIPSFDLGQRLVNLGYLPGGSIGLQEFASQPRYAAPYTWNRLDAWSSPMLQAVTGLKDFNAILLLTESADTARIWIEQVLPTLPKTLTYLVTSQQSSVLLLPYYNSGQLSGMISGIAGSRMYELLVTKPGAVQSLWDSYQIGILLIFVVILFGGILSSVSARRKRPHQQPRNKRS